MGHEKKRTPRAVERAEANRKANQARQVDNLIQLREQSRGALLGGGERPSRTLRRLKREQVRQQSAELLQRIAGALDLPEGGDAA